MTAAVIWFLGYFAVMVIVAGAAAQFEEDPPIAFLMALLWPMTLLMFLGVKLGRWVK